MNIDSISTLVTIGGGLLALLVSLDSRTRLARLGSAIESYSAMHEKLTAPDDRADVARLIHTKTRELVSEETPEARRQSRHVFLESLAGLMGFYLLALAFARWPEDGDAMAVTRFFLGVTFIIAAALFYRHTLSNVHKRLRQAQD